MRRILLSVCLLAMVAACARIEQRAQERQAVATGSAPVSTPPTLPTPPPTPVPVAISPEPILPTPQSTALPAPTQNGASGDFVKTVQVEGVTRTYRLHVPASYVPTQRISLVLNFHGFGSNGAQEETLSAMSEKADAENFLVAYPEGSRDPQRWGIVAQGNGRTDLAFVRALLAQLENDYPIDRSRIYATGFSNGAEFTNLLACNMADVFAAFSTVAGGYFYGLPCDTKHPVSIVAFHGTADNVLPYAGDKTGLMPVHDALGLWALRNDCATTPRVIFEKGDATGELWGGCRENAEVVLFTVEGGGHSWPGSLTLPRVLTTQDVNATDVMWLFFVTHPKP